MFLGRTPVANGIQQEFNTGKHEHGKGRKEQFAKTAQMTTATRDANFESQVNENIAIHHLHDELDARNTEMTAAER